MSEETDSKIDVSDFAKYREGETGCMAYLPSYLLSYTAL